MNYRCPICNSKMRHKTLVHENGVTLESEISCKDNYHHYAFFEHYGTSFEMINDYHFNYHYEEGKSQSHKDVNIELAIILAKRDYITQIAKESGVKKYRKIANDIQSVRNMDLLNGVIDFISLKFTKYNFFIFENITNLKEFQILKRYVDSIKIKNSNIEDYSILTELDKVDMLYLTNCENINFDSCSKNFEKIIQLEIKNSNVEDLNFLSKFPNLRKLEINSNEFSDISELYQLSQLETVNFANCNNIKL